MTQTKVTIREVAARAGFSITTVSQVLNDVPGKRIPDSTRSRVRAAAAELEYTPNRLAQGLRRQRSHTIGFVSDNIATTPFAGGLVQGAQEAASEFDSLLLLLNSGQDASLEDREIRALLDRQVDGIVYASMYHRVLTPPAVLKDTFTVLLDARAAQGLVSSVVPDEIGGARTAVTELSAHGHRRIAFINNVDDIPATHGRLGGYRSALADAGIPFDPDLLVFDRPETFAGYRAGKVLLGRADRPTAIFCFNDQVAMGVYQAAHELDLRIPEDLSVIGFDDLQLISAGLRPGLTTIALPHYDMGRWAIRTLMALVDDTGNGIVEHVALPCPLVRRASVGAVPA